MSSALRALRPLGLAPRRAFSTTPRAPLARLQVIGRLAAQPELKPTSTGAELLKYVVASDYGPRDNRQTSWFNVAAFLEEGPRREYLLGLPKGTLVHLDADAQIQYYEEQETGKKRNALNLIHRSIEVLSRPRINIEGSETSAAEEPASGVGAS